MFKAFRRLLASIESMASGLILLEHVLARIARQQEEFGPARERLDALELSRAKFEAEMSSLVLKAEGKFKAANNAEARERQLKKSNDRLAHDLAEDGDEDVSGEGRSNFLDDGARSEEERVQSVRVGVAMSNKSAAIAAKWGS